MTNIVAHAVQHQGSPFDSIRHFDKHGNEHWFGRELMPLLGYSKWQRFQEAIARAIVSCSNSKNANPEDHFSHLPGSVSGSGRTGDNFKLSRHACHLIAMAGDPRKPEIAAAQEYFSAKVYEAETVIPQQSEQIEALKLTLEIERNRVRSKELDHTMLTLHGAEIVLTLRGKEDQIVRQEVKTVEVVEPEENRSVKILTPDELKAQVQRRTGQKIRSLKQFADALRKAGRDDLLVPVRRHTVNEYITPDNLDEAIAVVFGNNRQRLIGE